MMRRVNESLTASFTITLVCLLTELTAYFSDCRLKMSKKQWITRTLKKQFDWEEGPYLCVFSCLDISSYVSFISLHWVFSFQPGIGFKKKTQLPSRVLSFSFLSFLFSQFHIFTVLFKRKLVCVLWHVTCCDLTVAIWRKKQVCTKDGVDFFAAVRWGLSRW